MTILRVPGISDSRSAASPLDQGAFKGRVEVKHAIAVQQARAAGSFEDVELDAGDIVELELSDGLWLWIRSEELQSDLKLTPSRSSGVLELPAQLPLNSRERGFGSFAIKALRVLGIDVPQVIGEFVKSQVEGRLAPGAGLYQCDLSDPPRLVPAQPLKEARYGKTLVLLHGTASSTQGSFGDLWAGPSTGERYMKQLASGYDRVLAFQHRSLSKGPIENTVELMQALSKVLPKQTELHLLSHSRGGLIGELLTRSMREGAAPFTSDEIELFETDNKTRRADGARLTQLNRMFADRRYQFTRFMRVACPARGTILADGRLDRYFAVLANLLGLTGLRHNPVFDGVTSLLAAVLKLRTQPEELPGLEAMMPTSPLIALLNRPDVVTRGDLLVLGGDLEGSGGVLNRLKTLATNFYYREDHDLVVNTKAMLGGTARKSAVRYWIDTGPEVTHFNYFKQATTASRIVTGLTGTQQQAHQAFRELTVKPFDVRSGDYQKRAATGREPVVFVIPGIMGSSLSVAGKNVWMDLWALANGGLRRLDINAKHVSASGLMRSSYHRLCEHLSATHQVVVFPYDWRMSLAKSAEQLRSALEAQLDADKTRPLRIVAHSMGGLVVRALLASPKGRATWQRITARTGARFVMLGTPSAGSHAMAAMLMGRDVLVKKLALLDLKHDYASVLETISAFDGVLQLLPTSSPDLDYFDSSTWGRLAEHDLPTARGLFNSSAASDRSAEVMWTLPKRAQLSEARSLLAKLQAVELDPERCIYVAGTAEGTPCAIRIDESAPVGRKVKVFATALGDGRVTWETGIPKNVPTYYMDVTHGDMADEPEHFDAIVDLLTIGRTSKLATHPSRRRAAAEELFELELPQIPTVFPDVEELACAAIGGRVGRTSDLPPLRQVQVRVIQDDVCHAIAPVVVGHYQDDMIVAAEADLDHKLDSRLSEMQRMELYAGPVGKSVVVLNEHQREPVDLTLHPGAIVVGLGQVGELTPGALTKTLAEGLTLYGSYCVARERRRRQRLQEERATMSGTVLAPIAALLVGSGGGVTLADSVACLLQAVSQANQRLDTRGTETSPGGVPAPDADTLIAFIDRVDILELYEDRAVQAVHVLRDLARSNIARGFIVQELLEYGGQGLRRARSDAELAWWQRMRITETKDGGLVFEALTQSARTVSAIRGHYLASAEAFINAAVSTTGNDPTLGSTLFELLVPTDFKLAAPDRRRLALVLDARAAAVPWELLQDKYDRGARPLSVETAMIRQLRWPSENARPSSPLRAATDSALVIGNPVTGDPKFPPLPAAESEALAVSELLGSAGFQTSKLTGDDATAVAILSAVHAQPWRILHLAAHGVFEYELHPEQGGRAKPRRQTRKVTGLVMSNGLFFTAEEAAQLRFMPDLVFINCCHLGNTGREEAYHRIAANLATQFIKAGARAVVAAGWTVDDAAAKTFATELYRALLSGARFGDAVKVARGEVYTRHGQTNTWGAYQCYGDTEYSLRIAQGLPPAAAAVAPVEVELRAKQLVQQAKHANPTRKAQLRAELHDMVAKLPPSFIGCAPMHEALGAAFGDLGDFAQACAQYRRAVKDASGLASLRCVEQWANLAARHAEDLGPDAPKILNDAGASLRALVAIAPSSERYALLGSLHKSRARLGSGKVQADALKQMRDAYQQAYRAAKTPSQQAYALSNFLAARLIADWHNTRKISRARSAELERDLKALADLATKLAASSTDYFDLATTADHLLVQSLATRKLNDQSVDKIASAYARATSRGAHKRQLDSALRHVKILGAIASSAQTGAAAAATSSFFGKLHTKLEALRG